MNSILPKRKASVDLSFYDVEIELNFAMRQNPLKLLQFITSICQFIQKAFLSVLYEGGGLLNLPGVFSGEVTPRFLKKLDIQKTAKSSNFKTINYILIRQILMVLWRILQKTKVFLVQQQKLCFFCENRHKTVKIVSKSRFFTLKNRL